MSGRAETMAEIFYGEALSRIRKIARERAKPLLEELEPGEAIGRVVAAPVESPVSIPQYSNSAVDGFALRSDEVSRISAPTRIAVLGSLIAGDTPPASPGDGAWEIMTGAPFPPGYDCSAKVEDVEVVRDSKGRATEIVLSQSLEAGENLRGAGEDFRKGALVLERGERIGPEQLLALVALGVSKLKVFRKPVVAVISTGGELTAPGEAPKDGQVRNSTAPFLLAALREMQTEPRFFGTAGDDPGEYFATLKKALESKPDVIISTGAVSMGVHDYVSAIVSDLGGKIHFHRVSIRPGKPILLAEFPDSIFFGLPGNPVSTVVGLRFFIEPFLRAWMGLPEEKPAWARLRAAAKKPAGLRCFFKARVSLEKGEAQATILKGQPSFMISPLLRSTAWGILPEDGREIPAGEWIEVYPFYSSSYSWSESHAESSAATPTGGGCCT
jgi:molybdopterin molybdotransferase